MKKPFALRLLSIVFSLSTIFCINQSLHAQNITVTGALVGNGSYATLGAAFNAINAGVQTGANINIYVVGNTFETVTAQLNQGAWNTLTINPSGNATRTIIGNNTGPLINLNGADRVLIDGVNTGGNALILDNDNNTSSITVQFINDAMNNTIINTTILGSSPDPNTSVVFFSTGATNGNSSNTISTCTIDAAIAGTVSPANCILSVGSAGMNNDSITITNCNIANFFNASVVSYGIYLASNNSDWTIQSNKFYQASTRTYTTANTHAAIKIAGGNNYSITSNTIGFANSAGTGTYAMTGTVATRFIGIDLSAGTTTASSIQGNTVSAIQLNTSSGATATNGILCGINVTAGNVNIGNINPNVIGATTGVNSLVATSTTTGGLLVGINSSSTNTVLIQGNQIGALSNSGVTAAVAGSVTGINVSGAAASITILNNTIGNSTADNMRGGTLGLTTGSSLVSGINFPSTPTAAIVQNNTIQNLISNGTGTSGFVRGIFTTTVTTLTSSFTITGNTVNNLTTNSGLTGMSSGLASAVGIHHLAGVGSVISGNTISNISNTNTGTTSIYVVGIASAASSVSTTTGTTIFNNTIYNLSNAGTSVTATAPAVVAGIAIRSGVATTRIYNNMISLGTGQTTNTAFVGILGNHGSTPDPIDNIYFNTINITGTAASGAICSFGIHRGDFTATARNITVDIRNNIITNTRSGGTGSHYAIGNNFNSTSSATGWGTNASNNNVLNANLSTVGYWGAALNFANWKAASSSDANSYSGLTVNYVNPVSNLHLNMGVTPTAIESGAQTIASVTNDIDGQVRPGPAGSVNGGAFAPDIGADEIDAVYLDAVAPNITYTPLTFTCTTGDRALTATIVDFSGVPTSGTLQPRIYFRKNAGTWFSNQGTLTAGTGTNGTWSFNITAATLGGVVLGDVIQYYVIVQDVSGSANITSNPSIGLVATNVNTVTTPPTTPNSYAISSNLSGTYTVGAAGTYPTLTAAAFAYNNSCLTGPVIFSLIDATYPSETFPIVFNANVYANSTNTLTIQPNTGVSPTISGSSTTAIIQILGGDYITINGSNSSTVNSICPEVTASRNLTIANTNTSTASAVVSLNTTAAGDAATNNKLMNCIVNGNAPATTGVAVNISGPTVGSGAGANGNNNNEITNNQIQQAQVGIFSSGSSIANKNLNNIFYLNDLNSSGGSAIGRIGMMILFEDKPMVVSNNVGNISNAASQDVMGIAIGFNAVSNTATTGAEVTKAYISNNNINGLVQTNTFSAVGIAIAASSDTNTVVNNMINGAFCNGTAGDFACGIYYGGGAGFLRVYHNTVNVGGATLTGASQPNTALGINGSTPNVDIRNNIFICTGDNGAGGNTGIGLSYTSTTGAYANLLCNYNDIFVAGASSCIGRTGGLAGGTQRITLLDWQTETGADVNGVNINPTYVGGTDVHIIAGSNAGIENAGTPISIVTSDLDCENRTSTPDLGADEVCFQPTTPTANATLSTICAGDTTTLSITSGSLNDAVDWYWYSGSCGGTLIGNGSSVDVNPSSSTNYFVRAEGSCVGTGPCISINIVVNPLPPVGYVATPNDSICIGDNVNLAGTGANSYSWTGGISDAVDFTPSTSTTYTVTGTDLNGCSATATADITVNSLPTVDFTVASNDTVCDGTSITLSGTGANTYAWTGGITDAVAFVATSSNSYTVTGTDVFGCSNTATADITVNPLPTVGYTALPGETVCNGTTVTLNGNGASSYVWTGGINDGVGFVPPSSNSYTVTGTDLNGCTNTATVNIVVNPNPTVNLGADIVQPNPPAVLDAGVGFSSYLWNTSATSQTISVTTNGQYIVTVTNALGCIDSDTIQVTFTAGLFNLDGSVATVSIYPNPTTSVLNLSVQNLFANDVITQILDVNGRVVLVNNPISINGYQLETYNVEQLSAGLYILRITANGQSSELRFIKK